MILRSFSKRLFKVVVNNSVERGLSVGQNGPVILMFGWLGCRWKYLNKYVDMYDDLGVSSVSSIPGFFSGFFPHGMSRNSKTVIENLQSLENIEERTIIPHVFSGMGMFFYHNLLNQLESEEYREINDIFHTNIRGQIFDSPIGSVNKKTTVRGFVGGSTSVTGRINYTNPFLSSIFGGLYGVMMGMSRYREAFSDEVYQENMKNLPKVPRLMLYSESDGVVDLEETLQLIEKQESMDLEVQKVCFEESLHCTHYPKYPERYIQNISSFLETVLE